DLACGLGPLAAPWMNLAADTRYYAADVDRRLVELVDGFLTICDVPHTVQHRDVLDSAALPSAGVVLLLMSVPCFEQQAPGSAGAPRLAGAQSGAVTPLHPRRTPGAPLTQQAGAVHAFICWDRPLPSAAGGFQAYSPTRQTPAAGVIRKNEVIFREPSTGQK